MPCDKNISILPARGHVYVVGKAGGGAYKVSGLSNPSQGILTTAIMLEEADAAAAHHGLGNQKVVISLGQMLGNFTIVMTTLTIMYPGATQQVISWFQQNRLSKSLKAIKMSTGKSGGGYSGYLTGMQVHAADTETGVQQITMTGWLAGN